MITFNYIGFTITIHNYIFCQGYKATLEEPGEDPQYIVEDVTITDENGKKFDDFYFFEVIDTLDFDKVATKHIINYEKSLTK
jgi:hypothetical protein